METEGQGCWEPLGPQSGCGGELHFQLGARMGESPKQRPKEDGWGQRPGSACIISWTVGKIKHDQGPESLTLSRASCLPVPGGATVLSPLDPTLPPSKAKANLLYKATPDTVALCIPKLKQ